MVVGISESLYPYSAKRNPGTMDKGVIGKERGVAQFGSAFALGAKGRRFKSCHPDQ